MLWSPASHRIHLIIHASIFMVPGKMNINMCLTHLPQINIVSG